MISLRLLHILLTQLLLTMIKNQTFKVRERRKQMGRNQLNEKNEVIFSVCTND